MYFIIEEKNTDWNEAKKKNVKMHIETPSKVTYRAEHLEIRKGITWEPREVIKVEVAKWQGNQQPHQRCTQEPWDKSVPNRSSCHDHTDMKN